MSSEALKSLGRYQIKGVLGQGAMGLVYDGHDPKLNRRVAIKTILTGKLSPDGFKEFVRKKTKDLQSKQNCRDVEYVVETVDGQVKLKALVKS